MSLPFTVNVPRSVVMRSSPTRPEGVFETTAIERGRPGLFPGTVVTVARYRLTVPTRSGSSNVFVQVKRGPMSQ